MKHAVLVLFLFWLTVPSLAEPGVALVLDSGKPGQVALSSQAKRFLGLLAQANRLAPEQLSLRSFDLATAEGRRFQKRYQLTRGDLPALITYRREGNRLELRQTLRAYTDPYAAAEWAFGLLAVEEPRLISLTKLWTGAELSSEPPGATVRDGEKELGVTPCRVSLHPGRSRLTLLHPDCLPSEIVLDLSVGEKEQHAVSLTAAPAELVLESGGPELELWLDGMPVGKTPLRLPVSAGPHRLTAESAGTHPLHLDLHAAAHQRTQVRLQPTTRKVRVGLIEVDADGYLIGPYYDPLPFSGDGVSFDSGALAREVESQLGHGFSVLPADALWDCGLKVDVDAWETYVTARLEIVSRDGTVLHNMSAERRMPLIRLQAERAARKRGAEMVRELTAQAALWISAHVEPGVVPAQPQSMELRSLGPLLD